MTPEMVALDVAELKAHMATTREDIAEIKDTLKELTQKVSDRNAEIYQRLDHQRTDISALQQRLAEMGQQLAVGRWLLAAVGSASITAIVGAIVAVIVKIG